MNRNGIYLVTEADAEHLLFHVVESLQDEAELEDPIVIAVCVVRAPAEDEALVLVQLVHLRELSFNHPKKIPPLTCHFPPKVHLISIIMCT